MRPASLPYHSGSAINHEPIHDADNDLHPDGIYPSVLDFDGYDPNTADPDLLLNDMTNTGGGPGLDSVFSRYLLELFSEQH
jgi:hypothetical protein